MNLGTGHFLSPLKSHVLFFGHTGSGKTTELRRYAEHLSGPERFFIVELDISVVLDRNNLQYADVLMAMARELFGRVKEKNIALGTDAMKDLEDWFGERILSTEEAKNFTMEMKTNTSAEGGISYLFKLFAGFTSAFKSNVTYKDSLRQVIRNSFTQFAVAFNRLLRRVEEELVNKSLGQRVLFIIDGTDKLRNEDTINLFAKDAEQLLEIEANIVYTAPLSIKYESNLTHRLNADLMLPMIKLYDAAGTRHEVGWQTMRDILLLRADRRMFATDQEISRLVEYSGGHPRELLRLIKLCCEFAENDKIDADVVDQSIRQLASEYRRFLAPEDYMLLAALDRNKDEKLPVHMGNDDHIRKLLYNLALLEYNDGSWRRSHPVIRILEGYSFAVAKLKATPSA
ncbi:conserved hypothetical protein [Gammaproteobacteria bacterium]